MKCFVLFLSIQCKYEVFNKWIFQKSITMPEPIESITLINYVINYGQCKVIVLSKRVRYIEGEEK